MNDEINEQLSALMDGEQLSPEETKSVLQAFKAKEEVRRRWENYHLIRDSLQGHLPEASLYDLAGQVSRALENEPHLLVEQHRGANVSRQLRLKWRYGAGLALAASLSAIAVLGIQALTSEPLVPESQIATTPPVVPGSEVMRAQENNRRVALEPEVEERLNTYLVNHTEYVDMPGMLRYGRIVSYESSR
ncbi:Anti sigma-E protein RseA family protein [Nitrosococcus halophilus Nc 4]|uniref:Anti sigma-E protein RseA family protein n=1 Tax=Nitrosococcus halophilus (strain Nc4) TaxID=472759 RepID=D5BX13_NITHN|nr:sigma-E factor negative regulatory protein [Nitrosococcus halophilus]ADE13894.1 Anti sigma-E protein RseA family protein [Nitrosococcus halophilus Nc 4]